MKKKTYMEELEEPIPTWLKKVGLGCIIIGTTVIVIAIISIISSIINSSLDKKQKDNDNFNEASSLLQEFKYEQALKKLESISSGYKKYDSVQILKQIASDSLSEISYKSAKDFFYKNDHLEALPLLKKVNKRHKEYNEAKNMIVYSNEMIEAMTAGLPVATYIESKNDGVSSKEIQKSLNDRADKISVLQEVVTKFGIVATQIKACEKLQNSEFKYLEDSKRNNLKAKFKKLTTQARGKLNKEQLRDFPLLRKEYAKISSVLYKDNFKVKAKGNRNTILEFTGPAFVSKESADSFLKILNESKLIQNQILPMRFKSIEFNSASNSYSVNYDTPTDDVEVNKKTYSCDNCKK